MNKEEMKEDIINDINKLIKDSKEENINELFNGTIEKKQVQQNPQIMQQNPAMMQQNPQMMQQKAPMQQMPPQMMHQMPPQMMQQMPQQMMHQMHPQMMQQMPQQLSPQQQQQMHQQMMNQQMLQGMNPQMMQRLQQMNNPNMVKEHLANQNNSSDGISKMIFSQRDSLVLFLLYIILLTPQVNSVMNKIPYTSDYNNYPGYLGILLRGIIFISLYIGMKNLNLL